MKINLETNERLLPKGSVHETIDQHLRYFKEKDASNAYRLAFTINPVCSNVLFNAITEIIKDEGSNTPIVIGEVPSNAIFPEETTAYLQNVKGITENDLTHSVALRDTAFSHEEVGNFTYHCGYDIFNNHMFRKNGFSVVSKLKEESTCEDFNTIFDMLRDKDGNPVECTPLRLDGDVINRTKVERHLYTIDDIKPFAQSMNDNLVEDNGWMGFMNPVTLEIPNYNTAIINKGINNEQGNKMIDMYPGRDLFSFTPKYNPFRKRIENNWDYCLTYPFEKVYIPEITGTKQINGLFCEKCVSFATIFESRGTLEGVLLKFQSVVKHGLQVGDFITMVFRNGENYETSEMVEVKEVGVMGKNEEYFFSVNSSDIINMIYGVVNEEEYDDYNTLSAAVRIDNNLETILFRRTIKGCDCEYYFRNFRKVPNFKETDVYAADGITEEEFSKSRELCSNANKLAFAENIFGDDASQIVFNDIVDTTGLKDNLGRDVSELYLTIIKRNKGYNEWYFNKEYGNPDIEYSHCFGKVDSGLDLLSGMTAYNIHKIHNVDITNEEYLGDMYGKIPVSSEKLEENITIENDTFLGDLVEFSPNTCTERIINDIYHRFNTVQREYSKDNEFKNIYYDEIKADDYDINADFTTGSTLYNSGVDGEGKETVYPANIFPEGYYYKPHYLIRIKEYEDNVNYSYHTKINYTELTGDTYGIIFKPLTNYYLYVGSELYFYNKETREYEKGIVEMFLEGGYVSVKFAGFSEGKYIIFKPNSSKPDYASELMDGTGRYYWKNFISSKDMTKDNELYDSVFANGCHYFHKNINFYVRRQKDLSYENLGAGIPNHLLSMTIGIENKDLSIAEYIS